MKTRADQTEKHTFSRSRYTAFSRSRAAEGFGSETQQGGFHGKVPVKPWWNSETWGRLRARDKQSDCFAWMATAQQQCKRQRETVNENT